ncbi:replication initiator protein A [Paraburkholderia aspalathi]|uniref:replication initiator protein A n=1 Tax=Paraburkholderia aspalathi TaxID=1324617 RepID=UPI001FD1B1C0|nr:replication initiator protein A [Paraburkholderia aspalathi]
MAKLIGPDPEWGAELWRLIYGLRSRMNRLCWVDHMTSMNNGPQPIGNLLGGNLLSRLEEAHAAYRKKLEAAALPGESIRDTEERLRAEEEKRPPRHDLPPSRPSVPAKVAMRRPPENERQADFFVASLYDVGARDSSSIMDVAVYRLSKRDKRAGEMIRYDLPSGYVEVTAGPYGMASVWDYDIVLMMVSHLTESMNLFKAGRGQMPGRKFVPHISDIAKFCRRGDGGRQADDIEAALDRLQGTMIKSVRETPSRNGKRNVREVESEGLIGLYRVVSRTDTGKVSSIEITAPNWIYREVTSGAKPDVLTVHRDYFLIESGLGRFVYRLARRAAGKTDAKWAFKTIYERSNSAGTFKKFCFTLRKIIKVNELPEYTLQEVAGQKGPLLVMRHKDVPDELLEPVTGS